MKHGVTVTVLVILTAAGSLVAGCSGGSSATAPSPSPPPPPSINVCGAIASVQSSGLAILNGSSCEPANSPVVRLTLVDSDGVRHATCSGTVIDARAVLTAAHCVTGSTASIIITFGTADFITATSFRASPGYHGENDPSSIDVGVVLTDQDFRQTPVPILVSRYAKVGEQAVIAGWGQNQQDATGILNAGATTITAVNSLALQTQYSGAPNSSGVCYGDSGGPILVSEGGVWAIAGVTEAFSGNSCSSGTNYFVNLGNPDVSSFVFSLVPHAVGK